MDNAVVLMLDAIQSGNTCEVVHVAGIITRLNDYNADCELNEQIIQRIITVITSQTMRGDAFTSYDLARYLKRETFILIQTIIPNTLLLPLCTDLLTRVKLKRECVMQFIVHRTQSQYIL